MAQSAIAGVAPAQESEVPIMAVFPSLAVTGLGELLGRIYSCDVGFAIGPIKLTIGKLAMAAFIPVALGLYALGIAPFVCTRYVLTNRRVMVQRGWACKPERWVHFSRFNAIELEQSAGQAWYRSADLVFRNGKTETFRLHSVPHAAAFRSTILKARMGYVGVNDLVPV